MHEIFYSLQGEGLLKGRPSTFIRLAGCSAKKLCKEKGIICDTNFDPYVEMDLDEIFDHMKKLKAMKCDWIIWTGGEPLDQLNERHLKFFKDLGFLQDVETSGIRPIIDGFDRIILSPKVPDELILNHWPLRKDRYHCDELKYVIKLGDEIPETNIKARNYYLSPHWDELHIIPFETINHCIGLCLANPEWSLSVQEHKLWSIR